MEYIQVTKENIAQEHICCAISNNKDVQVASKKAWLLERFEEGLVFLKSVERGKCFIEYLPAENAWNPIQAEGFMYIDCLWVSGSFKGHGYSSDLLDLCIRDSKEKGKKGLCILSAAKKKPFLADPKYLKHKGFSICDEADNGIQLWALPFSSDTAMPTFRECARHPRTEEAGYVSVLSTRNMSRSSSKPPGNTESHSKRFISQAKKKPETPPHRSRPMRCSGMEPI